MPPVSRARDDVDYCPMQPRPIRWLVRRSVDVRSWRMSTGLEPLSLSSGQLVGWPSARPSDGERLAAPALYSASCEAEHSRGLQSVGSWPPARPRCRPLSRPPNTNHKRPPPRHPPQGWPRPPNRPMLRHPVRFGWGWACSTSSPMRWPPIPERWCSSSRTSTRSDQSSALGPITAWPLVRYSASHWPAASMLKRRGRRVHRGGSGGRWLRHLVRGPWPCRNGDGGEPDGDALISLGCPLPGVDLRWGITAVSAGSPTKRIGTPPATRHLRGPKLVALRASRGERMSRRPTAGGRSSRTPVRSSL